MSLTSKERVQIALSHKEPDRVPRQVSFVPEMEALLLTKYRNELKSVNGNFEKNFCGISPLDIFFHNDMLFLQYGISSSYYKLTESETYLDNWGITWKKVYYKTINGIGYYTEIVEFPLADDKKIDSYIPPSPEEEDMGYAERVLENYGDNYYIVGDIDCSIFEALKYLRGITQSLIDIVANKDIAHKVMDISVDYHLRLGLKLIEKGVDMLWLADDVGGEYSLLVSPTTFREMIKPKMGYMINEFRNKKRDIKIGFHSDGYIEPIIDDLVEIGVDVLNPIQPESMNPSDIKKRYGKNMVLCGTVSTQRTFPFGKAEDLIDEVKERITTCAPGGGFIIAPTHNIQLDTPLENIEAFYYALNEFSEYFLKQS